VADGKQTIAHLLAYITLAADTDLKLAEIWMPDRDIGA